MPSVHNSEVVTYRGPGGGPGGSLARRGNAEEEWVTKKKVEITTTKNVERKIHRQLVLEDGRVVEEELPTVTVDTTEDKQTFETDQDEERQLEGGQGVVATSSRFDTKGGVLLGDKFTSVKKINDVKENTVRTEAVQNLGDITSRDIKKVLGPEKQDIRKYLRHRGEEKQAVAVAPRTVFTSRNHRIVTDKEDVQERNWLNNGKMQNERIRTEEHIEYDSDDSKASSSSSSSSSSHHKLEPEVYKTRKDENFTEYFNVGKDKTYTKVAEGPHYVSESKEVQRQEDRQVLGPSRTMRTQPPLRMAEVEIRDEPGRSRKTVTHTDSWLERHFGSSSSSLSNSSVDLSRPGSREGYGGLRRSASICDIRPVDNSSGVYYATVRKSGKTPPQVVMRDKTERSSNQTTLHNQNRSSAQFSSSGQPVRPPRRKRPESATYEEFTVNGTQMVKSTESRNPHGSMGESKTDGKDHVREKYYFGHPVTVQKSPGVHQSSTTRTHQSTTHSQNKETKSSTLGRQTQRPHQSTGNIYRATSREGQTHHTQKSRHLLRNEPHHLALEKGDKPVRYRSSQELHTESRRRVVESGGRTETEGRVGETVRRSGDQERRQRNRSSEVYSRSREAHQSSSDKTIPIQRDVPGDAERKRKQSLWKEERRGRPVDIYASSREIGVRPRGPNQDPSHRIVYSSDSPMGSPSTKYRTKIIVGGAG